MELLVPVIPYITNVGAVLTLVLMLIAFGFLIPKRFYDELKDQYDELKDIFKPMFEMVKKNDQTQADIQSGIVELNRKIDLIVEAQDADDVTS